MAKQKLGEFLIAKGLVSREEVAAALKAQRGSDQKLGQLLVRQGCLQE